MAEQKSAHSGQIRPFFFSLHSNMAEQKSTARIEYWDNWHFTFQYGRTKINSEFSLFAISVNFTFQYGRTKIKLLLFVVRVFQTLHSNMAEQKCGGNLMFAFSKDFTFQYGRTKILTLDSLPAGLAGLYIPIWQNKN